MIKAVIFDFGGVLLRTENLDGRIHWEQKLGLGFRQAEEIVFNSEMGCKAQHGGISYTELWQWVGEHFSLSAEDLQRFETDFWAGDVLDTQMVEMIRGLRPFYKTALISNAFNDLRDVLENQFQIADAFDVIVISSEEGVMKPAPRLYEIALEQLGVQANEAVFVDDFLHNIAGAQAVGMAAIHFKPEVDLAAELTRLGVEIRGGSVKRKT